MFAFFVSIVVLSASVFSGILFYVSPRIATPTNGKSVKISKLEASPTATTSPTLTALSPTITTTPSATISPTSVSPTKIVAENQLAIETTPTLTLSPSSTTIPTISNSPTPTAIETLSPTPTQKPTATQTISPTPATSQVSSTNSNGSGLNANVVFALINNHRSSKGLPAFQKDDTTCKVASQRAPQVYDEVFTTHNMHAGFNAMHFDYWITENIISIDTEQAAVDWWLQDTIHRQTIEGDYKYSCVACTGNSCAEIFTSYIPK